MYHTGGEFFIKSFKIGFKGLMKNGKTSNVEENCL